MHQIHNCVLSAGIALVILIYTQHALSLLKTYVAWELKTSELREPSQVEKRIHSRMKWKLVLDLLGPIVSMLFWITALVIRVFPKDLTEKAYKIYYILSTGFWQTLVLPYILISFLHSIYLLFVLIDDAGFTQSEASNKLFSSFNGLASDATKREKLSILDDLESIQQKYSCCGSTSYLDWLSINMNSPIHANEVGQTLGDLERNERDPWGQKYSTGYFPLSCCDRKQTIQCVPSILTPNEDLSLYYLSYEAPVYERNCVSAVYNQVYAELSGLILLFSFVDITLHCIQFYTQVKSYYVSAPRYPCFKWLHVLPPLQRFLTPPKMGSRRESTGSVTHRTGSITHMDGSRTHKDGSVTLPDGTFLPIPEKLMHRSGSITHRSGSRTHRTGSQTHVDGSRTHRTGSVTQADGSRIHRDKTITPGPGDSREVCMLGDRVKVFFGSTGYISTDRLLRACQGFHLYARPSLAQQEQMDVKSKWLENEKQIGWMLRGVGAQHACFVSRVPMKRNRAFTPAQTSDWRRFLRLHLPIVEAILFADGNAVLENEANSFYRSFGVAFIRGLLFVLFGILATSLLLPIYSSANLDSPILNTALDRPASEELRQKLDNEVRENVVVIQREVDKQSAFFLYMSVMIGSLVSRRVRCLFILILPIFAMRFGHIYLTNEMLHAVLVGPVANSEQNLIATGGTIGCLAEMSHNVTRDFERVNWLNATSDYVTRKYSDPLGNGTADYRGEEPSLLRMISKGSEDLVGGFKEYIEMWPPVDTLDAHYEKLAESIKGRFSTSEDFKDFLTSSDTIIRELEKYTDNRKQYIEHEIRNLTAENSMPAELQKALRQRLDKGSKTEKSMSRYMTFACMLYKQHNLTACREQADNVCSVLHSVIKSLHYQPIWYTQACDNANQYDYACPKMNFINDANLQCGLVPNTVGLEAGLGAYIIEAREAINTLQSAFVVNVSHSDENVQFMNYSDWLRFPPDRLELHQSAFPDGMTALFYALVIISSLGRLAFVGVIYGAHCYISNYLIDNNFDNIYADNMFEFIDAKRLKEGRETLLPLKSMESPYIYWRRKCYTSNELQSLFINLIFTLLVGCGLLIAFAVDTHIYELVTFLVDLTAGYYGMRTRIRNTYFSGTHAAVTGDGLFFNLTNKLIKNLGRLRDFNLDYDSAYCSPNVYQTSETHVKDFYRAWYSLIALVILAPALLRLRHVIASFFYPSRTRNRAVALYNLLLIQRRRHMTMCRNLVVHWVREGRLQQEARFQSEPNLFTALLPKLSAFLGFDKKTCIICQDRISAGREISVCSLDSAAVCRQCVAVVLKKDICVVCLDRNPKRLFKERRKIQRMENKLNLRLNEL
ncbi:Neuroglian [Fasciola hepatica]|uniref:Neuroglian n=1 Tax=Fasciola hepatica TaxID=6192 RepID=A0A4E0RMM3_FASHE|nr:Neuroglian [Fasciola hepatica]